MELLPTQEPDLGELNKAEIIYKFPKKGLFRMSPTLDLIPLINAAHTQS